MDTTIGGLHHVTMISTDPQRVVDFYAETLGLRLVKQTVNFDDPSTYHFYFANGTGEPGTVLTFFPMPGTYRGGRGYGQTTAVGLSVPPGTLPAWSERLTRHGVAVQDGDRFGAPMLAFEDPDGLLLELVEEESDGRAPWTGGGIGGALAIRGVHHVTLTQKDGGATSQMLTAMGYRQIQEDGGWSRWEVAGGGPGTYVDMVVEPDAARGSGGAGAVHHIAFRTPDDAAQAAWLDALRQMGRHTSEVMDRQYFHSIYFREPGGVLFEIATDGPGFLVDEPYESLGTALRLPSEYESFRGRIEAALTPITVPTPTILDKDGWPRAASKSESQPPQEPTNTGLPLTPESVDEDLPELETVS